MNQRVNLLNEESLYYKPLVSRSPKKVYAKDRDRYSRFLQARARRISIQGRMEISPRHLFPRKRRPNVHYVYIDRAHICIYMNGDVGSRCVTERGAGRGVGDPALHGGIIIGNTGIHACYILWILKVYSCCARLPPSLSLSLYLSLARSLSLSLALSFVRSLSLARSLARFLSLSLFLYRSLARSLSLSTKFDVWAVGLLGLQRSRVS